MNQEEFNVEISQDLRIDKYLFEKKIISSRSQISKLISEGYVSVNQNIILKPSYKVKSGDEIKIQIPDPISAEVIPQDIPLDILYEDKDIIVVNKSAGMVVHPAKGNLDKTLVNALLAHCKDLSGVGGVKRPGIVHRLDKGTSGCLVVAKHDQAHHELSHQFKNHEIEKIYLAFVFGEPTPDKDTIQNLISRSESNRLKYIVHESQGKEAITHYQTVWSERGLSLVKIRIETGRTHQIRVHFTDKGHSLVGDELYGKSSKKIQSLKISSNIKKLLTQLDHPLLHAYSLKFDHPLTKEKLFFKSEIPSDFKEILSLWNPSQEILKSNILF